MLSIPIVISFLALGFAFYLISWVKKCPQGTDKMQEIFELIKQGANAFLKRQYQTIAVISGLLALILLMAYGFSGNWLYGFQISAAFVFGAVCSLFSGFIGMWIAVRSNVRVARASQTSFSKALTIALRGGAVSGITIVAMSLLGISSLYLIYNFLGYEIAKIPSLIVGLDSGLL